MRKTSSKEKVKRRLSLRRRGISGRTGSIITNLGKITSDSQDLPTPRWLMLCSEDRCIEFWRRSRTSHSLNGRTRWLETPRGQPKPLLPIPSRPGTHYRGMQELMGPFGIAGPRRKVEAVVASFQRLGGVDWFESLEGCSFKTSSGNSQCHLFYSKKNRILSI